MYNHEYKQYDRNIVDLHDAAKSWFIELQGLICAEFEKIEDEYTKGNGAKFVSNNWKYSQEGGGTSMSMKGEVFEKVGVNFSQVEGKLDPKFANEIPGGSESQSFWASGISLVAHMKNPKVPSVHMNTRMITTKYHWIGGGADLTPSILFEEDNTDFHKAFEEACNRSDGSYYPRFKKWCDEYFFIKHRNEARGIGGIFYDYINSGSFEKDLTFTKDVGLTFLEIFSLLVRRRMNMQYNAEDKKIQLIKRGRYAEFNLVYDRGTRFGLMTNGNVDAILMSLPPEAIWL